ncbi:hypothetical protein, partial [Victivallis vadensis]|uniref:hypothetical protein n=1 Tax=Victivallis vadensis TaxID=172901 RepID=UPI003D03DAC2
IAWIADYANSPIKTTGRPLEFIPEVLLFLLQHIDKAFRRPYQTLLERLRLPSQAKAPRFRLHSP